VAAIIAVSAVMDPRLAAALGAVCAANLLLGAWRTGPGIRRMLIKDEGSK